MFPKPMPIQHDVKLFPRIFGTNKSFDVPYWPLDTEIAGLGEERNFTLLGSLCFRVVHNISLNQTDCILLYNQTAAWFDAPSESGQTNATWISARWPIAASKGNFPIPSQPKWSPFCTGRRDSALPPWTGCQSRGVRWAVKDHFTFSPNIGTLFNDTLPGYNWTFQNPAQAVVANPFDNWLLCGVNGSCTDLAPMAMVLGGGVGNASLYWNASETFESSVELKKPGKNITFGPIPVCVYPPFIFVVSNGTKVNDKVLNCNDETCFYTQCWNATQFDLAIIARMPRWVPLPVQAPNAMTLFRQKKDFGITAAIVTAISLAAVGATTAAIAMSQSVQTAQTLNNLSSTVAQALDVQTAINAQMKGGLMVVNQRIDLVQEQMDVL